VIKTNRAFIHAPCLDIGEITRFRACQLAWQKCVIGPLPILQSFLRPIESLGPSPRTHPPHHDALQRRAAPVLERLIILDGFCGAAMATPLAPQNQL
jgi:hypothetical protein